MKCVLLSIKQEHTYNIFSGEKDDEVRKRAPKLEPPFKCYVYCSGRSTVGKPVLLCNGVMATGFVVGEFICDRVETVRSKRAAMRRYPKLNTCISMDEMLQYMGSSDEVSFMHITERKLYVRLHPIFAFELWSPKISWERNEPEVTYELTRPPQSWCYVKDLEHTGLNARFSSASYVLPGFLPSPAAPDLRWITPQTYCGKCKYRCIGVPEGRCFLTGKLTKKNEWCIYGEKRRPQDGN